MRATRTKNEADAGGRSPRHVPEERSLLLAIGQRIRERRERLGLSRRELADRSGLSQRFLAQVEAGEGNVAVTRLARLARALEWSLAKVVDLDEADAERLPVVALVGLRGAGKSAIGRRVAQQLGVRFVEHTRLVEEEAGLSVSELFALHGETEYRRLAREALTRFLAGSSEPTILATSGGLVADDEAYERLRRRAHVVWLSATAEDHWNRVVAQGDQRPMEDHPDAMRQLRRLLQQREPLHRLASHHVDTSAAGLDSVVAEVGALARAALDPETPSA